MKRNHFAPVAKTRLPAETSCGLPLNNLIVHIETLQFSLMWWDCFKFCLQIWEIELTSRKEHWSRTDYLGCWTIDHCGVQTNHTTIFKLKNPKAQRSIFQRLKWHVCHIFLLEQTQGACYVRICKQEKVLLHNSADKQWVFLLTWFYNETAEILELFLIGLNIKSTHSTLLTWTHCHI